MTMQAVTQREPGGVDTMEIGEWQRPRLAPGKLLVRVMAAGVNRADLMQREGRYPPPPGASPLMGLEAAGWVEEAAEGSAFQPGDAVLGLVEGGGYAEYVLMDEVLAIAKPDELSWVEAASLPEAWMTAWFNLVEKAGVKSGDQVLIHAGASGVGAAAIRLAAMLGAQAFASAGSEEKLAFCRELGAARVFNYRDTPAFGELVKSWGGADAVLDPVGASYLAENLQALNPDGVLVNIGVMGGLKAELDFGRLLMKRISLVGSTLRPQPLQVKARLAAALRDRILPAILDGRIKIMVDSSYPWAQVADAHEYVAASRNLGKVVLTMFSPQVG
ncbi:NAD(P)H-quinone oxidoreductase [Chromobacterium sp. IIBBL 290-4]|uniref:NAD(P)H-quinone oxidoreductase n=1 Tax=Chromobacterium sp. IIBBL 290-4 TaxID=2953890 RepID=UPI0020B72FB3|nr:NAD(P)H-quinone oxidoreductase [Chromobacterium sp. IIBBL 290-4]UTH73852.1 NAD(P)H-quinone oxidoreductase [Chromobacterium sp. IIBBL 290-4]